MVVQDLQISLLIEEEEDWLHIEVKDNGSGFPEEMLYRIERNEDIEEDGKHIGITNVKNRLQVLYSDCAVVRIRNQREGSVVTVRIPKINNDERLEV